MKLSRTVAYALQATLQLAARDTSEPTPCSRLAAEGGMPERFLLQILRSLVTHGVLRSTRGVDGGYKLTRAPEEISLLQIIEAIDGPVAPDLSTVQRLPAESHERLRESFAQITRTMRDQLASIKLARLLPSGGLEDFHSGNGKSVGNGEANSEDDENERTQHGAPMVA
jgi:Rrf2 family protein